MIMILVNCIKLEREGFARYALSSSLLFLEEPCAKAMERSCKEM